MASEENDDLPESGAEGEEGEGAAKKKKKKLIIIAAAAVAFLLIAGGGAFFVLSGGNHDAELAKSQEKPDYYPMPEFLVNLNSGTKQASFLKTTIVLELKSPTDRLTVEANLPRLFDAFNTYLRELRASDLSGSAGIQRLREELLMRANQVLTPTKINDVLFKEIIVQ